MDFQVTPLQTCHIEDVTRLHMDSFPGFFMTELGPRFLKEFYRSFLHDSQGIGFVALDTSTHKTIGVVVGALNPVGYYRHLFWKRWYAFFLSSTAALLKNPRIAKRLIRAVRYRGDGLRYPAYALLNSIAVIPQHQSQGVGKALVLRWLHAVEAAGTRGAYLTTDADANDTVNRFYRNLGWQLDGTYTTPEGRNMNWHVYHFSRDTTATGRD